MLVGGVPNRTVIQRVVFRGSFALAGDEMEREQVARCADFDPDGGWSLEPARPGRPQRSIYWWHREPSRDDIEIKAQKGPSWEAHLHGTQATARGPSALYSRVEVVVTPRGRMGTQPSPRSRSPSAAQEEVGTVLDIASAPQ